MKIHTFATVLSSALLFSPTNAFSSDKPSFLFAKSYQWSHNSLKTQLRRAPNFNCRQSIVLHATTFESVDEASLDAEERMIKSIESVKKNLQTIRTGRANPSILDRVQVEYYGAPTPLNQLASISVPSSQQLSISPFDKSCISAISRAIVESGLGLTPNSDGSVIRINIPPITVRPVTVSVAQSALSYVYICRIVTLYRIFF